MDPKKEKTITKSQLVPPPLPQAGHGSACQTQSTQATTPSGEISLFSSALSFNLFNKRVSFLRMYVWIGTCCQFCLFEITNRGKAGQKRLSCKAHLAHNAHTHLYTCTHITHTGDKLVRLVSKSESNNTLVKTSWIFIQEEDGHSLTSCNQWQTTYTQISC